MQLSSVPRVCGEPALDANVIVTVVMSSDNRVVRVALGGTDHPGGWEIADPSGSMLDTSVTGATESQLNLMLSGRVSEGERSIAVQGEIEALWCAH